MSCHCQWVWTEPDRQTLYDAFWAQNHAFSDCNNQPLKYLSHSWNFWHCTHISSDVNKDLTLKDKDQTLKAKDQDKDQTYKDKGQTPKDKDQTFKAKDQDKD